MVPVPDFPSKNWFSISENEMGRSSDVLRMDENEETREDASTLSESEVVRVLVVSCHGVS